MSKKVSLGTKWAFQEIPDPADKLPPLYGIDADGASYRIMPSRNVPGEWNLDVHKKLSGWEDAVSGKTFKTPEAAAKVLVKMHAETQSKSSEKNIQAQLRSARPGFYEERSMGNMQEILERAAGDAIGEAVGANLVTRMAEAMLSAPKLAVLMTRAFDDESQEGMFAGMIQGPLEALIAKALDAAGATVSGGVLSKSNREMRGAARGDLSAESMDVSATMSEILEPMDGGEVYSEDKVTDGWKSGGKVPPGYRVVFGKLRKVGARGPGGMQLPTTPGEMLHAINKMKKGGKKKPSQSPPAGRSAEQAAYDRRNAGRQDAEWMKHGDLFRM